MVLSRNERNTVGRLSHSMRRFTKVLNELGLRDLLCRGALSPGAVATTTNVCPVLIDFWLRLIGKVSSAMCFKVLSRDSV